MITKLYNEKFLKGVKSLGEYIEIFVNPSLNELKNFEMLKNHGVIRAILHKKTDEVFIWDSPILLHVEVLSTLNYKLYEVVTLELLKRGDYKLTSSNLNVNGEDLNEIVNNSKNLNLILNNMRYV